MTNPDTDPNLMIPRTAYRELRAEASRYRDERDQYEAVVTWLAMLDQPVAADERRSLTLNTIIAEAQAACERVAERRRKGPSS